MSGFFESNKGLWAKGLVDWTTDDIRCVFVDEGGAGGVPLLGSDTLLSDMTTVGTAVAVTGKTVSDTGVMDCDDPTFTGLTGATCEGLVFYVNGTVDGKVNPVLIYIDGITLTPDGSNVLVTLPSGANKVGKL